MLSLFCIFIFVKEIFGNNIFGKTETLCVTLSTGEYICVPADKINDFKDTSLAEVRGFHEYELRYFLQITAVIPPKDKDAIYYIIVSLFVSATFASTLLTGAFLVMSMIFWKNFKQVQKMVSLFFLLRLSDEILLVSDSINDCCIPIVFP